MINVQEATGPTMRLHRGIAVPRSDATDIAAAIRAQGLKPVEGGWKLMFHDLKPQLNSLWQRPTIRLSDTRPNTEYPEWICACAEELGATYYACRHNRTTERDAPLLITFEADIRRVIVDGRDFLYTLFQVGVPPRTRPIAERLFGAGILPYLDRAWSVEGEQRIAICDLAIQDESVIRAHSLNSVVIGGANRNALL